MTTNIHPHVLFRESGSKLFYEKGVLKNSMKKVFLKKFSKFTRKYLCRNVSSMKLELQVGGLRLY